MKTRKVIFFDVLGHCEECKRSLFISDKNYKVGDHFIHHFYKVDCVVTNIKTQTL